VAESVPHVEPEARKRRSTRIAQAVPLTVTGVDALGRPFQERTSTLFVNCHGCRYQSKHYVLKNMWVTVEVPHPEAGREPRVARGRVTWIQRPRTVRELFQIGVDLEIPGNIWGIAFPPADWFAAPESAAPEIPFHEEAPTPSQHAPAPDPEWETPAAPAEAKNVVVIGGAASPGAGADVSLHLARQVARLVVEAKQQIQAAVREATSRTVTQEMKQLITSVEKQLHDAASKAVHSAAESYSKHWVDSAAERIEMQARSSSEALREKWASEMDAHMEEARTLMAARVAGVEKTEEESFKIALGASVDAAIDRLRQSADAAAARNEQVREQFERSRQELRSAVEEATRRWEQVLSGRTTDAASQMEQIKEAAGQFSGQIQRTVEEAEQNWRARMEAEIAEARNRAAAQATSAVEEALHAATGRIAKQSEQEVDRLQEQADNQMVALRRQAEFLHSQATHAVEEFRTQWLLEAERSQSVLAQVQQSAEHVTQIARQIDEAQHNTISHLEQRANELLDVTTRELAARSEATVSGIGAKLQPILEEAGMQTVSRLGQQLEQGLASQMETAHQVMEKLSTAQTAADEVFRAQQDRIWQASEQQVQQATLRIKEISAREEKDWQESIHATMAKWVEELDSRATDITHISVESLYKSANWYEKKVQTQMQSSLDKGIEQAGEALRVRAGEMSGLFASELDHYSRSFVEHAQVELGETAKDALAKTHDSIRAAVEAGSGEVGAKARRAAQVELERFSAALQNTFDQSAAQVEAHAVQVRARMGTETRQFLADFQTNLSQRAQESLRATGKELEDQAAAIREAARAEGVEQEKQFSILLSQASNAAIETYKGRMENASNAWLLTSAAKLNQDGENHIESLARAAEKKLREVFSQVFASVGDSLRDRLLGIAAPAPSASNPSSENNPEKP
jgi:hypothetical protein